MDRRIVPLSTFPLALLLLASCAAGAPGSARRACADTGLQPGTPEFETCWRGVRDRQFASDAPAMGVGLAAGAVAAGAASGGGYGAIPAQQSPGFGTLKAHYASGLNRVCVYATSRGDYSLTVSGSQLCPQTVR